MKLICKSGPFFVPFYIASSTFSSCSEKSCNIILTKLIHGIVLVKVLQFLSKLGNSNPCVCFIIYKMREVNYNNTKPSASDLALTGSETTILIKSSSSFKTAQTSSPFKFFKSPILKMCYSCFYSIKAFITHYVSQLKYGFFDIRDFTFISQ